MKPPNILQHSHDNWMTTEMDADAADAHAHAGGGGGEDEYLSDSSASVSSLGSERSSLSDSSMPLPCLPLDDMPASDSAMPLDGYEYLRRVRDEAARIPNTVTCDTTMHLKFSSAQQGSDEPACDVAQTNEHVERHVNPAWVHEFVASFEELRVSLEACASAGAVSSQITVPAPPASVNDHQGWRRFAAKNEPTTQILAAVREHEAPILLSWLTEELTAADDAIDERRAAWVYGVMARLGWPLDADAASSLRVVLRHAARARREHAHDAEVHARAHVLMAAAGVYFKQAGVDEDEFRLL